MRDNDNTVYYSIFEQGKFLKPLVILTEHNFELFLTDLAIKNPVIFNKVIKHLNPLKKK